MKQYDGIKDEELISRFKNGESEILDYLMEKYKNMQESKDHVPDRRGER